MNRLTYATEPGVQKTKNYQKLRDCSQDNSCAASSGKPVCSPDSSGHGIAGILHIILHHTTIQHGAPPPASQRCVKKERGPLTYSETYRVEDTATYQFSKRSATLPVQLPVPPNHTNLPHVLIVFL